MRVLILADDLTGALDTTCKFGRNSIVLLKGDLDAEFVGVSTFTRLLSPEDARTRLRDFLRKFSSWSYLYKKTDSTMRGNVGAELGELSFFTGSEVPFTPAYPEQGRLVIEGSLYVRGEPLDRTPYVSELPVKSSNILAILRATTSARIGFWGEEDLDIAVFKDVRSREDLSEIINEILGEGLRVMGGSAGLAIELSEALGCVDAEPVRAEGPILFLSGSTNDVTLEQISLLSREITVLGFGDEEIKLAGELIKEGTDTALSFHLGSVIGSMDKILELIIDSRPSALVVIGGETLGAVLKGLDATAIRIGSYPEEGIAAGWLLGGPLDGTPLVSKAGGFGDPWTLVRVRRVLRGLSPAVST